MRTLALTLVTLALTGSAPAGAEPPAVVATAPEALVQRFGPAVRVTWNATRTAPRRLSGLRVETRGADVGARALGFVREHAALLGLDGDVRVTEDRGVTLPTGRAGAPASFHSVRLGQLWNGRPVEGRSLVVRLDAQQRVVSLTSDLGPLSVPEPASRIDADAARRAVREAYHSDAVGTPREVVLAHGPAGRYAYKVPLAAIPLQAHFFVWVDVETGRILGEAPAGFDQTLTELPVAEDRP